MLIEPASRKAIQEIAAIHVEAFPGHFLTQLGQPFLRRYYTLVIEYPLGILLTAKSPWGKVHGFVTGFLNPPQFYALMQRKRWSLGLRVIWPLLRRPCLAKRLLHDRGRVANTAYEEPDQLQIVELSSIAIEPEQQGQGLGRELVESFCRHAAKFGAEIMYLTTDAENNDRVNAFYKGLCFSCERYADAARDRPMNKYVKLLNRNGNAET